MAKIAERYVKALLNSSKDKEQSMMFQEGLENISKLYSSNKEFKNLLVNPCISNEEKLNAMKEIFSKYCSNTTFTNFLLELLNKNRISSIESIAEEYTKINGSLNKEVTIKIIVASKIGDEEIEKIVDKYKKIYNANMINYTIEVDESIIGGVKVAVGNTIYDSSIATQLKQIF